MKIFLGLGNPGAEYAQTRHNAGFLFLDQLAKKLNLAFKFNKKFNADLAAVRDDLFLIKPQTFMNRSGQSIRAFYDWLKIDFKDSLNGPTAGPNDLIVVHDDLDLKLGTYKLQKAKGPKGHNGLQSVYEHLDTQDFWHLRLGVDSRGGERSIPPADYVLKTLTATEREPLQAVFDQLLQELI